MILLLPCLRAETLLLLAQFGRQRLAEILGVEDLPDFDLGAVIERRPLHPFDRLVQRFDLDQPKTANQIAGKAERTATHGASLAWKFNSRALRTRVQPLACEHNACRHHL